MSEIMMNDATYLAGWLNYFKFQPLSPADARGDFEGTLTPKAAKTLVEYQRPVIRYGHVPIAAEYVPAEPVTLVLRENGHIVQGATDLLAIAQNETAYRAFVRLDPRPANAPAPGR
jgi:hypothetical protein